MLSDGNYFEIFTFFLIFFAVLREKAYPNASEYVDDKKHDLITKMKNGDSFTILKDFVILHSKLHEYERLKSRVDLYIVCSKWSCIGIIAFSFVGIVSIYLPNDLAIQNVITPLLIALGLIFLIATTSLPAVSDLLTRLMGMK
jgi:hypothetical protein